MLEITKVGNAEFLQMDDNGEKSINIDEISHIHIRHYDDGATLYMYLRGMDHPIGIVHDPDQILTIAKMFGLGDTDD